MENSKNTEQKPLIEIRNLKYSRGSRVIFDGIDLDIQQGKITAIMGPSGTGKTTLLRLIGGQLRPAEGEIWVDDRNVHKLKRSDLYKLRKSMGVLFQSGALLTDLTLYENVAFPIREHTNLSEELVRNLVLLKLQAVGLRGAKNLYPRELSGGMGRRAALARAIALDPAMVMYDEPFAGQDPISMGILVQLIKRLNDALGLTSIIVSHDVAETTSIADYVYILSNGVVVGKGTPEEIYATDSGWVKQFVQGEPDGPVPFHYSQDDFYKELMVEA